MASYKCPVLYALFPSKRAASAASSAAVQSAKILSADSLFWRGVSRKSERETSSDGTEHASRVYSGDAFAPFPLAAEFLSLSSDFDAFLFFLFDSIPALVLFALTSGGAID